MSDKESETNYRKTNRSQPKLIKQSPQKFKRKNQKTLKLKERLTNKMES